MIDTSDAYKSAINAGTRTFRVRCDIYMDGISANPTELKGTEEIVSCSLLEEAFSDTDIPTGAVTSNEFSLTLNNIDHRYTPTNTSSPYHNKLVPNLKVVPYLDLKVANNGNDSDYESIPLGTFWSQDWDATSSDCEVTTTCHDRLYDIGQLDCPRLRMQQNISVHDAFVILFTALGLSTSDFEVDESLSYTLLYMWLPNGIVKDALTDLAVGANCIVYVNRYNKIIVKNIFKNVTRSGYLDSTSQVTFASMPTSYLKIYNIVKVNQKIPSINASSSILSLPNITLNPGLTTYTKLAFSSGPVAIFNQLSIVGGNNFLSLTDLSYDAWTISFSIMNSGTVPFTVNINGYGQILTFTNSEAISAQSDAKFNSTKQLTIDNDFIQDYTQAINYSKRMLTYVEDPGAYVNVEYRGNPAIEIWDTILLTDPEDKIDGLDIAPIRIELDFDGSLTAKMLALKVSSKIIKDWVYLCPGLFAYCARNI
jgi:hypothetical protein